MLRSLSHFTGSTITATNGAIGHVSTAFFDDESWAIRYLVIDTGNWLPGREVLISPYAVKQPVGSGKNINVSLTRDQIEGSPDIDTHQPVSRQHERDYLRYYDYPDYWNGGSIWGLGAYPRLPYPLTSEEVEANAAARQQDLRLADVHLRSSEKVTGYDILATDESIGHVQDFIFDEESWAIRYLVIDTRNWWPGGRKVLVATRWIESVDWVSSTVEVALTRDQVKNSPEYEDALTIERSYEQQLHVTYDKKGYWEEIGRIGKVVPNQSRHVQ